MSATVAAATLLADPVVVLGAVVAGGLGRAVGGGAARRRLRVVAAHRRSPAGSSRSDPAEGRPPGRAGEVRAPGLGGSPPGVRVWRRAAPRASSEDAGPQELDAVLVLELVGAALATGAALPRALAVVGEAVGGRTGAALRRAGAALLLGATWASAWAGAPPAVTAVAGALEGAWSSGASPAAALRARADRLRRERRRAVRTAAARLSVHLVLPLGACFLPAFVLIGLVPVVLSLAAGLFGP
ncbi:type II secretion system F family protein [Cellulomonas fimi]|uniref:Type II secretion system F domain protein n=3 Tax=Cellulomonas fimi TaxID=1708 RepID=F4H057_CELFA|nr:type II secretion system F family protein [Cellulomonas fimi]AEE44979.1 Type II secretion system F domain protein [Cellulomonas fimi ATCC 484]